MLDIDLLTILIAYLYLSYGHTAASPFALGQGLLVDLFSGGIHGLFASLFLVVFAAISLSHLFFNLQNPRGQVIAVFIAIVLKKIAFFIILSVFLVQGIEFEFSWRVFGFSMVLTALLAPLLVSVFDRVKTAFIRVASASSEQ